MIDIPSSTIQGMISSPGFLSRMMQPVKVIFKFDIPYASGISQDGTTVYIDKNLKRFLKSKDVVQFLIIFEKARKALMDLNPRLNPQQAHYLATRYFEHKAVKTAHIDWSDYEKFLAPQFKTPDKAHNIPKDLDISHFNPREATFIKTKQIKQKEVKSDKDIRQGRMSKLRNGKAAPNVK